MKKIKHLFTVILASVLLSGCATLVTTNVERPAELDLQGATSIAVLPFSVVEKDFDSIDALFEVFDFFLNPRETSVGRHSYSKNEISNYLTSGIINGIYSSNYFTLVNSATISEQIKANRRISCDTYISGTITNYKEIIDHKVEKKEVDDKTVRVDKYRRKVNFDVNYKIIDASTKTIIFAKSYNFSDNSSYYNRRNEVPDALSIIRYDLDSFVKTVTRQIQPYTESKQLWLIKDNTKDPQMKLANQLAKHYQLKEAQALFYSLWSEKGYPEALYNSAVLLESLEKYEEAKKQLSKALGYGFDDKVFRQMEDIDSEISKKKRLNNQMNSRGNRAKPSRHHLENNNSKEIKKSPEETSGDFADEDNDNIEGLF